MKVKSPPIKILKFNFKSCFLCIYVEIIYYPSHLPFYQPLNQFMAKEFKETHIPICFYGLVKIARETVYTSFMYGALLFNPPWNESILINIKESRLKVILLGITMFFAVLVKLDIHNDHICRG